MNQNVAVTPWTIGSALPLERVPQKPTDEFVVPGEIAPFQDRFVTEKPVLVVVNTPFQRLDPSCVPDKFTLTFHDFVAVVAPLLTKMVAQ